MKFSFDDFVEDVRKVAVIPGSTNAIRQLMAIALESPDAMVEANPLNDGVSEIMLFEDETASVWVCKFEPDQVVPPHEHKMDAFIGVFQGAENNLFFKKQDDQLKHIKTKLVKTGEQLSIGKDGIHSVVAAGETSALSFHVYTGPLSNIRRSLFDWESGIEMDFTDENYEKMKKSKNDLPYL